MYRIAIFGSGSGSNAEQIITYFKARKDVSVELILSNRNDAYILERAQKHTIESISFDRHTFYKTTQIEELLKRRHIDLIVLAGFLWLVPSYLITAYLHRIINIHPSLLPRYGGKGMYGIRVHQAVFDNKESESGITIHYVNEVYDQGTVIRQEKVDIRDCQNAQEIAQRVLALEHIYFAKTIEEELSKNKGIKND